MSRRWLIVGVFLSLGLHTMLLWPLLGGASKTKESSVATESTPETVDVVAVAMPEAETDVATMLDPTSPSAREQEPPAKDAGILAELTSAKEEPPAAPVQDLKGVPFEDEPLSPLTTVAEVEPRAAPEFVVDDADVDVPAPQKQVLELETAAASEPSTETPPVRARSQVVARLQETPVVVEAAPPMLNTVSRTAAMMGPRAVPAVPTPRGDLPDAAEIQQRIDAANIRNRPTPSSVRSDQVGDHLSTQNGPARVVPQIEWRTLSRWRAVAAVSGLRLIALSVEGAPAAFIAESQGRWLRNSMAEPFSGYSSRVRIVDHVAAFQPARSSLRPGERLAILVPQSIEALMENAMQEAIRQRSLQPSDVAVCSGVLQPDGDRNVVFRVDRISSRHSS